MAMLTQVRRELAGRSSRLRPQPHQQLFLHATPHQRVPSRAGRPQPSLIDRSVTRSMRPSRSLEHTSLTLNYEKY